MVTHCWYVVCCFIELLVLLTGAPTVSESYTPDFLHASVALPMAQAATKIVTTPILAQPGYGMDRNSSPA